jgi:glycosyltransferase involved in cell wall biosynthesis
VQYLGIEESKIRVVYQSCNPIFSGKAEESLMLEIRELYDLPSEFILYVGTIEERKNLLQVVKAMNEGKIDFPLVVIGNETPYARKVYEYVSRHTMENIWFLRNVPVKHLPSIYQMASLFVYPSSYEGFGLPVLEALNSGVPVIAATGSCLEETGGNGSRYVNPANTSELSAAISEVLFSESRRKTMIEEGHKHALGFSPEKSIQNLWKVYESLF